MSTARLQALRLVGFKSFAERTVVEFGGGISAIVGPNGSGKSNLADALRWALGEQGRQLRTRRAEDLIFAGSSSRRAQGMADVTLVLDNTDRLLPVDFAEVELGRRLFRSGENEYLLNRQRVRLRDLTDLLDEANLADNAFLFIGQGMVDQALALRPEERRPLFEEAAGTRRHERRRRAAEVELAEAESNLERVRDVLDELRPQARRLAAQAQQQEARHIAGLELATALVAAARERLGGGGEEARRQAGLLTTAHADADVAMNQLHEAEAAVAELGRLLAARSITEREVRTALDAARARLLELRLAESRNAGDAQVLGRDRARLADERAAIEARMKDAARQAAVALPDHDVASEDALREAERRLAEANRELAEVREAGQAGEQRDRRAREAREARHADLERAQRRSGDAARRAAEQAATASEASARAAESEVHQAQLQGAAGAAAADETAADAALEQSRLAAAEADARAAAAAAHAAGLRVEAAGLTARRDSVARLLAPAAEARLPAQLRAAGSHRLIEGIEVDPALRDAVEAALGDVLEGLVVPGASVGELRGAGGVLVIAERSAGRGGRERDAALVARAEALGGGALAQALRRDPRGHVTRLLARCLWLPDLAAALAFADALPAGWRVTTQAGEVVTDEGLVRLAKGGSVLQLRAESTDLDRSLERATALLKASEADLEVATAAASTLREAVLEARRAAEGARSSRRIADEAERAGARRTEAAVRERAWSEAQTERLARDAAAAEADLAARQAEQTSWLPDDRPGAGGTTSGTLAAQVEALAARAGTLRRERDELAAALDAQTRRREAAAEVLRRAEIRLAMDAARQDELEREVRRLLELEGEATAGGERIAAALTAGLAEEARLLVQLGELEIAGSDERDRLARAEAAVVTTRERLRTAEARARLAEVAAMEARLQLDAGRQALLVELAGIGEDGLLALRAGSGASAGAPFVPGEAGSPPSTAGDAAEAEDLTPLLEAALESALEAWREQSSTGSPVSAAAAPGTGKLSALRRRYHELGSGNPYAAQELADVQARLETLDGQRTDLETAIRETRELIGRLERLITEQFRSTFAALEGAFARRFEQLFGGGEAQLSLTLPDDLSATGVEITARPPGKKRQPLAMLSGGERALTAVSLLLAMLEVRPVPFCVLDEVDAALDEANVGRFSAALRGLAEHIQFIVITHNRGTIEAADALYGVTVGDDAVSHVISLRLDGPDAGAGSRGATRDRPAGEREAVAVPIGRDPVDAEGAA